MIGFFLGGSRRMAEKYPDLIKITNLCTDWDYNVQHSQEVIDFLERIGCFRVDGNPNYNDDQAVCFYRLNNNITVVTRKNIGTYVAAFEMMQPDEYLKYHWKSSPCLADKFDRNKTRDFFNQLFKKAEEQQ